MWIRSHPDGDAPKPVQDLYDAGRDPDSGEVDAILRAHGLHAEGLAGHLALYRAVMAGTKGLRRSERELIAVVVSVLNRCGY